MLKLIKYEYRRNLAGAIAMLAGVLLAQGVHLGLRQARKGEHADLAGDEGEGHP